jgi:hypothetical protein
MTDVPEGFPKPKQTRPWQCRRQEPTCTRVSPCRACLGARNRRKGMRKQGVARKAIEHTFEAQAARFVGQLGNEESWTGLPIRNEVKSGAQVRCVWTKYLLAEEQANANRAIGDNRPFAAIFMADHTNDGLFTVRISVLREVLEAFVAAISDGQDG